MTTEFIPYSDLHGELHFKFEESEIAGEIKHKLNDLKKVVHIKGFRQGTVPDVLVKKLYGNDVRNEVMTKSLEKAIVNYQTDSGKKLVGDLIPIPNENNETLLFKFEAGFRPQFDVDPLVENIQLPKYSVIIPETMIEEELEHFLKSRSKREETSEAIVDSDYIKLQLNGKFVDGAEISSDCFVLCDDQLTDEFKAELMGKTKGHRFSADIRQVEKNQDDQSIRKYFLKLEEQDNREFESQFDFEIGEIQRLVKPDLNEEFYKMNFSPEQNITDEAGLRAHLRSEVERYFEGQTDKLFEQDLVEFLIHKAKLELPESFLKKWLTSSFQEWQGLEENDLNHKFYHFKESFNWTLISDAIRTEKNLEVDYEDVVQSIINKAKEQFAGYQLPEDQWRSFANRMMQDEKKHEEYIHQARIAKIVDFLKSIATEDKKEISLDDFKEMIRKKNSHDHHH
ncbi:MAG TPA: trigger factor [Saprospiraceae bacterium]|nr:trigger factor [Saprospiraceae bacterium]